MENNIEEIKDEVTPGSGIFTKDEEQEIMGKIDPKTAEEVRELAKKLEEKKNLGQNS